MNIAAYCRVSTDKEDQLNSLETQKNYFSEFAKRNGHNLVKLYADEGISGTKIRKRIQFQRMLADAEKGLFDMVVVKDISRFARNTVDLLQSVRKLKALGIETQFLTANMTNMGDSEFILTIFGALAQEESANTSKRIKFSKKINAEKGRVPNLVYGYDKTIGDYFNLTVNKEEAKVVQRIFHLYTEEGYGQAKIADLLNEQGICTKRNNKWSQNAIGRIITNRIYIGKIVNGRQEVEDFLTGKRKVNDETKWFVVDRPEYRIIEDDVFNKAQTILKSRSESFHVSHERQSNKYLFSTLIKCKECGRSFRRISRQYVNTYVRWVCTSHNGKGKDHCPNAVAVDEEELIQMLQDYFLEILDKKEKIVNYIVKEFRKIYKEKDDNVAREKELQQELDRIQKARKKYMDMYTEDIITKEEIKDKMKDLNEKRERIENELKMLSFHMSKSDKLEDILSATFKGIEDVTDVREMTNAQLKQIISKIEVDKEGNVDIYLRLIGDLGLTETVFIDSMLKDENDVEFESADMNIPNTDACT